MKNIVGGSIKKKLLISFLPITLVPLIILAAVTYLSSRSALTHQITQDFDAIAVGKEQAVVQYLLGAKRAIEVYRHARTITQALESINNKTADVVQAAEDLNAYVRERLEANPLVQEFMIMDQRGKVVACTEPREMGLDKSQDPYFTGAQQNDFFIKDVYQSKTTGKIGFVVSGAVKDIKKGEFLGVFAERISLQGLNELLGNRMGLGGTGESYLLNKDGVVVTESRFVKDASLQLKADTEAVKLFYKTGKNFGGVYQDYRNNLVLGCVAGEQIKKAFDYLGWAVVAEMDAGEAFAPVKKLGTLLLFIVIVTIIAVIAFTLVIAENIASPVKRLAGTANTVAGGDLTGSIPVSGNDEIGLLGKSFETMVANLRELLLKIQESTSQITSASTEILAATQEQASAAREQSSAVAETTSAAKELSATSQMVGESVKRVSQVAAHAMSGMSKIKESISKTNGMLASLGEKSQKIGKITELIDDVADQTNLLAVNASIEAARAGEQGRGFTVVADEIRKLADSTAKSTKDITALIELIQHEMSNAIVSMEQSVTSVDEEAQLAQQTTEKAKEIAMSTGQQISGSKQIADAMLSIDEAMKQVAAGAQQSQASAKQLTELAGTLKQLASKFKL